MNYAVHLIDIVFRYSKENKLPSPRERIKFNRIIKEAESKVIQEGNYQIGTLFHNSLLHFMSFTHSVLYLQ